MISGRKMHDKWVFMKWACLPASHGRGVVSLTAAPYVFVESSAEHMNGDRMILAVNEVVY